MPTSESERLALREKLAEALGSETAGNLMEYIPPERWDELATKTDLRQFGNQLQTEMRGLKSEMRGEMKGMQGEMKGMRGEMKGMQAETEQRFVELERRIVAVQGDISELAREVTDKMARQSRNLILAWLAMTVPIWVSMLVAVLVAVLSGSTA